MVNKWLNEEILKALKALNFEVSESDINLERPDDLKLGDFSTNVAMFMAKKVGLNPKDLAEQVKTQILKSRNPNIEDVQVAGGGFINFYLSSEFLNNSLQEILSKQESYGQLAFLSGSKVMIEFTDPNPFKEFHIGHLMSNTIGESLSRLISSCGAELRRACYQGDVGMHVAMTLWGMLKLEEEFPEVSSSLTEKVKFLGKAYAFGATEYKEGSDNAKDGIKIINKKVYKRSDPKLNELYDLGRAWSLDYFEQIYVRLGTKFDYYFFESETAGVGQKMVEEGLTRHIFEKSDGAVIFAGEKFDSKLHTRVFINAEGLPTYEAKELGLAYLKNQKYSADIFVSVTGNEVNDYFKVVFRAMQELSPDLAMRVRHLSHGMLRLPTGKMSSRTGEVVTAENLLSEVRERVLAKIDREDLTEEEIGVITEAVAIGAIKYSILKQRIGKDIIFDFDKSLSLEGDSGPYLQYAYTRALSVLNKAGEVATESLRSDLACPSKPWRSRERPLKGPASMIALEALLYRLPEVVERAYQDLAPQQLITYLLEVASAFNRFYAENKIIGSDNETYYLALTRATSIVLKNGLNLLAIPVLEKM